MDRLYSWVGLMALSVVNIGAIVDQFDERTGKQNFALAVACISLIAGSIMTVGNIIDRLRNLIIGNVVENAVAAILLALWVISIAFIQSPANGFATAIVNGQEIILYANLYFFSWLTFLITVYLVGTSFRDNFQFGPKFSQWTLLFTSSIILLATAVSLREEICQAKDETTCERTKYAVAIGGIGIAMSAIAVIASVFGIMIRMLELAITFLCTVLYFFGVVFLTSASGPASSMGNMYFSVWGGCFVSFMLMLGNILPNNESEIEDEGGHGGNPGMDEENL